MPVRGILLLAVHDLFLLPAPNIHGQIYGYIDILYIIHIYICIYVYVCAKLCVLCFDIIYEMAYYSLF